MGNSIRHLLRMVLEYLGLASHNNQLGYHGDVRCKKERSRQKTLIRLIGSSLPLKPCRRVCFQTLKETRYTLRSRRKPTFIDDECEPLPMATLADVPWIEVFSPDKSAVARTEYRGSYKRTGRRYRPVQLVQPVLQSALTETFEGPVRQMKTPAKETTTVATSDPISMKKIDALEEELAKLRAQIAMIVTTQQSYPAIPVPPPPFGAPPCGAPPPPPPPPPAIEQAKQYSIKDQIKKNKALKGQIDDSPSSNTNTGGGMPNMTDVLKGLGSVKLRSIASSPGGTPIRQAPKPSNAMDAATLIAQALKKKFAHRLVDSPNKENNQQAFTPSPNKSPKVGPQMLKPSQRRRSIKGKKSRPLQPINA